MAALAVPSFAFGQGFNAKTPADVARNRAVAQAMLLQGTQPKSLGTGLSAVGEAIIARLANDRADQAQSEGQAHAADVLKTLTSGAPSQGDLVSAMSDPWVANNPGESAVAQTLYSRELQKSDPAYQLDLATKKAQLGLTEAKINGGFYGDSDTAAAQRIVMNGDPASKQYAIAYNELYGGKTQTQQTPDGLVTFQVQNPPPAGVAPPTYGGNDIPAAAAPAADPATAQPSIPGPDGQPLPVAPTSATPAAAAAPAATPGVKLIPGTKGSPTELQARNGAIGRILLNEVPTVGKTFAALADPKGQLLAAIPGGLGNAWQDPTYQQAASSVATTVSDVLYSLSGASSNPDEVIKQIANLTPVFGDKPPLIADKLRRFKTTVRAIVSEANDSALTKAVEDAIAGMDAPASDTGTGGGAIDDLVKKYSTP